MFYDLNVRWTPNESELQKSLAFSAELGYNVVALNHNLSGKLPADIVNPIPSPLPFVSPTALAILRRCTLTLTDPFPNSRIPALQSAYDLLAIRPLDESTFFSACANLECDIISLDLAKRLQFILKFRTIRLAIERGVKFEICYSPGVLANDASARRNLISNATQLIRATRGRGLVVSSEAGRAVGLRAPWDVVNLCAVWGLGPERGMEAVGKLARSVVVSAKMRRSSYRGIIDIVYGGEQHVEGGQGKKDKQGEGKNKRKRKEGNGAERKQDDESNASSETGKAGKKAKIPASSEGIEG
ncbi:MAG: hypothetical protein M1820_006411 [Bogoriella megaspora]|nr:MAG: hypothetical protein M1820_006411 [Bogoriella megaspora]